MTEEINSECGFNIGHTSHDTYNMSKATQNRGREGSGIGVKTTEGTIDVHKWLGEVTRFRLENIASNLVGVIFCGHNRYSTSGAKDPQALLNASHPHVIGGEDHIYPEHIVTRNASACCVHNGNIPPEFLSDISLEGLRSDCDTERFLHLYKKIGEKELIRRVPGAYSVAIFDAERDEAIVMRDSHSMRPCHIGIKDGRYIAASEDFAIKEIGGRPIRELGGGEIAYIKNRDIRIETVYPQNPQICFFENNYLANHDSTCQGVRVWDIRFELGRQLAREFRPGDADIVTYVPDCPEPYARGYAEETRLQGNEVRFQELFDKRKSERSFMGSEQELRKKSISNNLYLKDNIDVRGKIIVLIDDSIVRGNVSQEAVQQLLKAGAKRVYFISGTPPIGAIVNREPRGCYYGVDIDPLSDKFAIRENGSPAAIASKIGATSVHYISEDGMFKAYAKFGLDRGEFCTYCIGGPKPF